MTQGAHARIRLDAIRKNLATIRASAPEARVMAVVKANAYGHGMLRVAESLRAADALAVARMSEARTLREAGMELPVVVLSGPMSRHEVDEAANLDLQLCVHDERHIGWLESAGRKTGIVWLKVDTGMNRLGIGVERAADAITRVLACVPDRNLRLMTHFSSADCPDDSTTLEQIDRFATVIRHFDGPVSIANSAGILGWAAALQAIGGERQVWVRPGLALYGLSPFPGECGAERGLVPAMQFASQLVSVKPLKSGACVGYGGTWRADRDTTLGIVAAGYGDGYSRYIPSGTPVIVNGRRVPIVGRISMDLCAVDLGATADERAGDAVLLWGDALPAEEIARHAGTIPYQLVSGVTHREAPLFEAG